MEVVGYKVGSSSQLIEIASVIRSSLDTEF